MLKKISIALFAVLFVTACGTANNEPAPNEVPNDEVPNEENIAPDNQDELDSRDGDRIDEEGIPGDQPDVDMNEEPMDDNDRDMGEDRDHDNSKRNNE